MAQPDADAMLRVQRIIHGALIASLAFYVFVAYSLMKQPLTGPPPASTFLYVLAGIAALETALLSMLRSRLLPADNAPSALDQLVPPTRPPTKTPALGRLFNAQMITWGICESMAAFGIIAVVVAHELNWCFGFIALSLVNLILYRPSAELIASAARIDASTSTG